jgi:hypothetical protein
MRTEQPVLTTSVMAQENLARFQFVGFDGNVCAAGAKALGVVATNTGVGNMAPAGVLGIFCVIAGAPITVGLDVEADANGNAIPHNTGVVNGVAMDAATVAGNVIRVVRGIGA